MLTRGELQLFELSNTPVIDALKKYICDGTIRFHMPGHKGGQAAGNLLADFLGNKVFEADVTNIPGMDDLHQTHGIIKEAQEMAAKTFGADDTYFLINGSSCGLQALVMTVCNPGDKILVPRNMHRSILSGIILSGAVPVFFKPEYDAGFGIPLGTSPDTIADSLNCHPDVKAAIIVNPTYHGIVSNVTRIAEIVHAYNIPLLVDEAHGPHLYFHEELPQTALEAGADASVQGTHKILSAFTQASMLHTRGNLINKQRLEATLRLLQSTSTSYLLLASLDAARAQMGALGRQLMQDALDLSDFLRHEINKISGFRVLGNEITEKKGVFGLDRTKITISVRELGVAGLWAEQWLRRHHSIQVEMSDIFNLLLIVTFGNRQKDAYRLLKALMELKKRVNSVPEKEYQYRISEDLNPVPGIPELVISPREAFTAPADLLPLQQAAGRISIEVIACYPPGIPVICPGEKITGEIVEYLATMREIGMHFQGCSDPYLRTICVAR